MNEDELERRIRTALHVEAPAGQVARLESFWRARLRGERQRRWAGRAVVAAAGVTAIGVATAWLMRTAPLDAPIVAVHEHAPALPEGGREPIAEPFAPPRLVDSPPVPPPSVPAAPASPAGRPATDYERLMFAISTRGQIESRQMELAAVVDAAVEELADNPRLPAAELAESDELQHPAVESLLLERLPREEEGKQQAIVQLLGEFGTPRATAALVAASDRDALRPAVVDALERIIGVDQFHGIVRQTRSRELRADLLERMITADSDAALRGFLSLVLSEKLRPEALAVADCAVEPPVGPLMKLLEDDDKSTRLAAAVTLGHMNGPAVTAALIELVTDRPSASAEAWVALLACRGESADRFLAAAAHEPRWLGHVNNARITWARMVQ